MHNVCIFSPLKPLYSLYTNVQRRRERCPTNISAQKRFDLVRSKLRLLKVQFLQPQQYYVHIYQTSDDTDKCNCVHMPDHKNSPALCCVHAAQHVHGSRIVMVRQTLNFKPTCRQSLNDIYKVNNMLDRPASCPRNMGFKRIPLMCMCQSLTAVDCFDISKHIYSTSERMSSSLRNVHTTK